MKWTDHIKQFPELERRWNNIPEATKTLFEIQIDAFANGLLANPVAWITIDGQGRNLEPEDQQRIEVTVDTEKIYQGKFTTQIDHEPKYFIKNEDDPHYEGSGHGMPFRNFKFWRPAQ